VERAPQHRIGLPWYEAADYPAIRALMVDGPDLPPGYATWERQQRQAELETQARGAQVRRVLIRPDEFAGWCRDNYCEPDAVARLRYADFKANEDGA
jgi:hypothetical protein